MLTDAPVSAQKIPIGGVWVGVGRSEGGEGGGRTAHLFIVLLVSAHGCELLFFHNLHEALLQALAHQHL